jgi:hypothetical protein
MDTAQNEDFAEEGSGYDAKTEQEKNRTILNYTIW